MSARDANIEISVSDDGMSASVTGYVSATDGGAPLSLGTLEQAVDAAGVKIKMLYGVPERIVKDMAKGVDVTGTVIAKGTDPVRAKDATIKPNGDLKLPVFPNAPFCEIIPATEAVNGQTVTGQPIKAPGPEKGKGISFPPASNCFIDTTTLQVRSELYGLAHFDKQQLSVRSIMRISPDHMRVDAHIYARDYRGKLITADRMLEALEAQEIQAALDTNTLGAAIREALDTKGEVLNVPIARGTEPVNGRDGWFELYVVDDRSTIGTEDDSGKVDYRARGVVRSVKEGTKVGKLHAPSRGTPGKDVFGRIIPARDGAVFRFQLGENVEATAHGSEYVALISGMVFFIQNILSVTEVYQTRGDVNLVTGNLQLEKGSVHVRGSVLSGFAIDSPRNVLVDDVVESAEIKAGGDVEVKGGIIMDRGGKITAQGGISAMFAKGATIEAQGDVNIAHETTNCIIFAKQNMVATKGRGVIVGSTVRCGGTIIANEVGSDLGVTTSIFLGLHHESNIDYSQRKRELNTLLQKVYGSLGAGDPRVILANTPKERREAVAKLLRLRLSAEKEMQVIAEEIVREKEAKKQAQKAKLKVLKTIYPGTIINCYGIVHKITKPMDNSQFYYNAEEQRIVVASL